MSDRLCAWGVIHNSHGTHVDRVCFLPEGEKPDADIAWVRLPWLDERAETATPIPMRLVCEGCGELHIDEGEFATKPHHTHACQHCGLTWRPAVVATVGVQFLPGFKNKEQPR
jgi:hypothetical protein